MQVLVIDLLKDFALRFFGTDSPIWQEYLEGVVERTKTAREATEKMRSGQRTELRKFIKTNEPIVAAARTRVAQLKQRLSDVVRSKRTDEVAVISSEIRNLGRQLQDYKPPAPPRKLGNLETSFREYRDLFGVASDACFNTNAICASLNFDAFTELSSSHCGDHKWKIPVQIGLICGEHVTSICAPDSNQRSLMVTPPDVTIGSSGSNPATNLISSDSSSRCSCS